MQRQRINVSECHLQSWSEYYKVSIHNTRRGLMIPPFPADGLSSRQSSNEPKVHMNGVTVL